MNFKIKCALQWAFSYLPKGERLNYVFQKYYSKSLFDADWFQSKIKMAHTHFKNFNAYNTLENNTKKYYEFGAGWDLIIPLYMGLNNFEVTTIDIRRLVFPELINMALQNYISHKGELAFDCNINLPADPIDKENDILDFIQKQCHVNYLAPCDARNTKLESNSIDFISSTATFEHIPENDLKDILMESHRILKKGGIISTKIDYRDHWAFFDTSLSYYNYLTFSEDQWKKYNPPMHYQNRLRHKDYLSIISECGFKILDEELVLPTDEERLALKNLDIDNAYNNYSIAELEVQQSTLVLSKS